MSKIQRLRQLLTRVQGVGRNYFKPDSDAVLRTLHRESHPDAFIGESDSDQLEAANIFKEFTRLHVVATTPTIKLGDYAVQPILKVGDLADIHLTEDGQYLLKISRLQGADKLLQHEREILDKLWEVAGGTTYENYLPEDIKTFTIKSAIVQQVNVFSYAPEFVSLEDIKATHGTLEGRHLAWIFKRLLTILGFVHSQGIVHASVLPCHVLINPETHGLMLIDWTQATKGEPLKSVVTKYKDMYPVEVTGKVRGTYTATDIYMAARCINWLNAEQLPSHFDMHLRSCLLYNVSMRPSDAWALVDDLSVALLADYGPPKFIPLELKAK